MKHVRIASLVVLLVLLCAGVDALRVSFVSSRVHGAELSGSFTGMLSGASRSDQSRSLLAIAPAEPDLPVAPQLPQTWAPNPSPASTASECYASVFGRPTITINFPASSTGGSWAGGGPYSANSTGSLQQLVNDMERYRSAHQAAANIRAVIPAGALFSSGTTLSLPQTAGDNSTNCLALVTGGTLTPSQTVCAHGIQDNISESTDAGTRNPACTSPNDVAQMWTIETTGANISAISTANPNTDGVAPHHWAIVGAEIRPSSAAASMFILVRIGQLNRSNEKTIAALPSHIYFDRDWLHGNRSDAFTGNTNIQHALTFDCNTCAFMNSQISQTIYPGNESQGIWMAQSQTIKIVHNWIEGTSENIFCGGDAEYIPGLQSCNDLEVRRNRLTYPGAWLGTTKWPGTAQSMARKNCTEFKSANRVLQDGNICENVDDSGGQLRPFGLNPKAYNGVVPQYWTVISNITWTNNILRHVCNQGAWFGERSSPSPNGQGVSLPLQRLNLSNNLAYDISKPSFCSAADNVGMGMQWNSSDTQFTGCSGARDDRGKVVTLTCVNNGTGMAQTDTAVGDPVTVSGCTDSSFNAGGAVLGPPALPGTNGLIVVYANRGAANATTNGCVFDNFQGYPKYSIYSHNTLIELPASPGGFYVSLTHGKRVGFAFMQFNTVRDNIITAGGVQGQGLGDTGNQTSQSVNWDLTTSQWHHNIYVGRGCSDYVDVLTSGGKQKSPPATSFCPANAFCSGQDPGARSCVGFTGAMGTTSLNVNLSDWNGYGLCHDGKLGCSKASLYAAGEKRQASDRMDVGASMPAIGTAETRTKYECRGSCGPGPFSD